MKKFYPYESVFTAGWERLHFFKNSAGDIVLIDDEMSEVFVICDGHFLKLMLHSMRRQKNNFRTNLRLTNGGKNEVYSFPSFVCFKIVYRRKAIGYMYSFAHEIQYIFCRFVRHWTFVERILVNAARPNIFHTFAILIHG